MSQQKTCMDDIYIYISIYIYIYIYRAKLATTYIYIYIYIYIYMYLFLSIADHTHRGIIVYDIVVYLYMSLYRICNQAPTGVWMMGCSGSPSHVLAAAAVQPPPPYRTDGKAGTWPHLQVAVCGRRRLSLQVAVAQRCRRLVAGPAAAVSCPPRPASGSADRVRGGDNVS